MMAVLAACGPESGDSLSGPSGQTNPTGQTGPSGQTNPTSLTDDGAGPTAGGATDSDGADTGASTGGSVASGIEGAFLLAVSTTVDRSKPLQFIATNVVTPTKGGQQLSTCLQPLSLNQGQVLWPREPVGDPLCFKDVALVGDAFTLDMGIVSLSGAANPITGANIVSTLILTGSVQGDDFYCGAVAGEVQEPPVGSIAGSSFAAVRLAAGEMLPNLVVIDCEGVTVTDL